MRKLMRFYLSIIFLVIMNSLAAQEKLLPGKTIESKIDALKPDIYVVRLKKGELANITLAQKEASLFAVVRDPKDSLAQVVDENGTGQNEVINIIADTSGDYTIAVHWNFVKPLSGKYSISLALIAQADTNEVGKAKQFFESWYTGKGPGAAVLVVKGNKIVFEASKGYADLEAKQKITSVSVFELASASKQFTAFAIALLVDRKIISLDDDIRKYIPEMHDYGTKITVANLVYHTSGIRDWVECFQFMGITPEDIATQQIVINFAINQKHLKFTPGEKYSYCNTNYNLLAEIITRATKQSFATWMKENVFVPLQMNATFIKETPGFVYENKVLNYRPAGEKFEQRLLNNAATGSQACYSNMQDLLKWVNSFNTKQLITPAVEKLLATTGILNDGKSTSYAFGNNLTQYKGFEKIDHLGLFCGFRTSIARFPKEDLAVVYLSNDDNDASYGRATKIADVFLHARAYKPAARRTPDAAVVLKEMETRAQQFPTIPLEEYEGIYFSPELGSSLKIMIKDKRLAIVHPRMNDIVLPFSKKDDFGFVRFARDERDKINKFTILGEGMEFIRLNN
jgi:CubicO group peptidase (beta-lactamase class C family)